jgi:pimeloyl-ACP methyl ester carboxylesterase
MRWRAPHPQPGAQPGPRRLHYLELDSGQSSRWLYALHGIYGAGRNWASIARSLVSARPEWGIVLVDLRLHGRSQGFGPPHTLLACAHDLFELVGDLGKPADAILGHSFGGKVALMSAGQLTPDQVWVVDSTPSRRSPGGGAYRMLQILRRLPGPFESRSEAVELLVERQVVPFVAHWMATNLEWRDGRFRWRLDLDGLEALLDDFFRTDLWDVAEGPPDGTHIHFVKATESDVMPEAECARLENGFLGRGTSLHRVHGGHWIHVDNPDDLLAVLGRELD